MTTLLLLTLRTSGILLSVLAAYAACRRRSAALRHLLLAAGVVAALAVTPLTFVLPSWNVLPSFAWAVASAVDEAGAGLPASIGATPQEPTPTDVATASSGEGVARPASATRAAWLEGVVLLIWMAGALAGLGVLLAGVVRQVRRASAFQPVTDTRWRAAAAQAAGELGLRRPVRLLSAPNAAICTWGVWRPSIAVPADALDWPEARTCTVLRHELAHVARGDWGVQIVSAILRALFWFNPLVWVVHRRLRDEAERACDDVVLRLGTNGSVYAEHLLDIARGPAPAPAIVMSMARSSTLEGRVAAMLNIDARRTVPSRGTRAAIFAAVALATCGAAALGVAAQRGPLSLHGSVYDSSGAVLPAVEMALVNDRGIEWTTVTDGQGVFQFDPVGPGEYVLKATMPGFRPFEQKVALDGARDWQRSITLQVGTLQETIRTTAKRPAPVASPAAASAAGATRVRVGGNIKPPTKTKDVRPVYPESMRAQGLEGTVPLETVIGKDGRVLFARVASAQVHPEFARAAIEAVQRWEFTPTLLNGVPVEVTMTASISFGLVD